MATTQRQTRSSPDLTIIIVNWNVGHLVEACLRSLHELTERASFEVYVVDNGSRHGDLDNAILAFPEVNYIFLRENLGFSKANNVAIKRARGRYVALLNPDTFLVNNAFDRLVDYLDEHPEAGAAGPKLLTPDGGIQFDAARNLPTLATEFAHNFFVHSLFPHSRLGGSDYIRWWDHQDARNVGALCGACMVVRAEAIGEAGLLDENFFLYWEDVEWCRRIGRAGWKISYRPEAEVHHLGGHSMAQDASASLECSYRSAVLYFQKHHSIAAANAARGLIFCGSILRMFLALGLALVPGHAAEARDRLRCYGRTMAWLLTGRARPAHSENKMKPEPVSALVPDGSEPGTRPDGSELSAVSNHRSRESAPVPPAFTTRKGSELL